MITKSLHDINISEEHGEPSPIFGVNTSKRPMSLSLPSPPHHTHHTQIHIFAVYILYDEAVLETHGRYTLSNTLQE